MVVIRGRLAPEVGAVLVQALAAAREALYQRAHASDVPAETPTTAQQQADALVLVAETALHHGIDPGTPGERYQVVVRGPDGRLLPEVPPGVALPADPVHGLRSRHEAQGLYLHARTAMPGWLGERLNVGWAIGVLHPLALRSDPSCAPPADLPGR
jgi:hypothetical protein